MHDLRLQQTDIDRLVDDELDEGERNQLLTQIESTDAWRQVALTFLEAQALRRGFREMCVPAASGVDIESTDRVAGLATIEPAVPVATQSENASLGSRRLRHAGIVAAAAVVAVAAVLWSRQIDQPIRQPDMTSKSHLPQPDVTANSRNAVDQANDLPPSVQFVVNDGHSDFPRVLELPIQSQADVMNSWEPRSALSDDVYQWLNASGHEVEEASSLVPVTLPNGRHVVFPVNQVRVNYRGPKWHQ